MTITNFSTEVQAAIQAAINATEEIMDVYLNDFDTIIKEDGSPVTAADLRSSKAITTVLASTSIPIIDEEGAKQPYELRKTWSKCWIIDPVDGTREFVNKNGEFAICIALVENEKPVFGLIASPVQRYMVFGGKKMGIFEMNYTEKLEPIPIDTTPNEIEKCVVLTSRSHDSGLIDTYLKTLESQYGELIYRRKGSALKFIELVKQTAHSYPRFANTMEWDVAAGQALLEAVGGSVINVETDKPLTYNKPNLTNPFFIAKNIR
jgi:3'(2'), 5'-bisphosphate nucleotidase